MKEFWGYTFFIFSLTLFIASFSNSIYSETGRAILLVIISLIFFIVSFFLLQENPKFIGNVSLGLCLIFVFRIIIISFNGIINGGQFALLIIYSIALLIGGLVGLFYEQL